MVVYRNMEMYDMTQLGNDLTTNFIFDSELAYMMLDIVIELDGI